MRQLALTALFVALGVRAAFPAAPAVEEVAPGVRLIAGRTVAGSQPDGNSIVIDAPDGLIVMDTGRHVAHTQRLLDVAKADGRPIRAIINSHWCSTQKRRCSWRGIW